MPAPRPGALATDGCSVIGPVVLEQFQKDRSGRGGLAVKRGDPDVPNDLMRTGVE